MQRGVQQCEEAEVPLIRPRVAAAHQPIRHSPQNGHATIRELTSNSAYFAAAGAMSGWVSPDGMGDDNLKSSFGNERGKLTRPGGSPFDANGTKTMDLPIRGLGDFRDAAASADHATDYWFAPAATAVAMYFE